MEYRLLEPGDSVLVALSGGPDSVALLTLLSKLKPQFKLTLNAVYINHQIRPQAAKKEEKFCRELCDRLGVSFQLVSENIPRLSKKVRRGIEETARNYRYEQFEKLAAELECDKIALGHHLDDRVETILFRILRGTGRTGLKGIPVKRGKYVRPLFDVSKQEILKYLKEKKIKYCVDQSNSKVEFTRNFIRNKLLPLIRKEVNSNVDAAVLNLIDNVSDEEDFLDSLAQKAYDKCVSHSPAGKLVLALKEFGGYDKWIQRRIIRRCLIIVSGTFDFPDKVTVDRIMAVALGKEKAVSVPNRINCIKSKWQLFIFKPVIERFSKKLNVGKSAKIDEIGFEIETEVLKEFAPAGISGRRSTKVIVDFDKLSPPLLVRNIRTGDRFQPLGLKGTKKVGDYLTDRKATALLRDEIPVVADSVGIVWLVGYEIDERVKIDQDTKKALKIEYSPSCQAKTASV